MARRISIPRVVCALAAAGFLGGAVYFWLEHRRLSRAFDEWTVAQPMAIAVDLSRPGRVTTPFIQTCQISHGEAIYLTVDHDDEQLPSDLLEGLDATMTIADASGEQVQSMELATKADLSDHDTNEPIMLAYFHSFKTGEYTATIDVADGAERLSGIEQSLHARYHLCGLERLPAVIMSVFAVACGVPGLAMGVWVVIGVARHGWARPEPSAE